MKIDFKIYGLMIFAILSCKSADVKRASDLMGREIQAPLNNVEKKELFTILNNAKNLKKYGFKQMTPYSKKEKDSLYSNIKEKFFDIKTTARLYTDTAKGMYGYYNERYNKNFIKFKL